MKEIITALMLTTLIGQVNAMDDDLVLKHSQTSSQKLSSLNVEAEETLQDILSLNEMSKKMIALEKENDLFKKDPTVQVIKDISSQYATDLVNILPSIMKEENSIKRKEMIELVNQKDNPFSSFYY